MYPLANVFLVSLLQKFQNSDIGILKFIYENRNPFWDKTFIAITDTAAVLAFGIPLVLLFIALFTKNIDLRRNALLIVIPVAISAIVANVVKYSIDLPRPYELYPFIVKLSSGGSPSFPSGHTADAFAFAVAVSIVYPKWYVVTSTLVWASLVGYSRMNLGVHFPSDVLAGAIIGAVCAFAYIRIVNRKHVLLE